MKLFVFQDSLCDGEDFNTVTYFVPEGKILEQARANSELELLCVVEADLDAEENQGMVRAIQQEGLFYSGTGRILLPAD